MGAVSTITTAIAAWLGVWLLVELVLAARQWRHLGGPGAESARRVRYGRYRALFHWLASAEQVARVALWLPAGALALLYRPFSGFGLAGAAGFFAVFALADTLLKQPLVWARWYFVARRFGVSNMRARELAGDALKTLALNTTLAALAAVWTLWPFALAPPIAAWAASAVLVIAGLAGVYWARVRVVAPLFNRFYALPAGELRDRLDAMLARCGARLNQVLVVDSSRRSKLANAYFTGFGRHKRVVLFDTLIAHLAPAELEAVMAHELGHYRCGHLRRYYLLVAALVAVGYFAFGVVQAGAGYALAPAAAAIAAYLLLGALGWPATPWLAWLRRRYEYEADAYAARHAEAGALISALEKLLGHNLNAATMDRAYAAFHATHPPGGHRLARLRARQ